MFSNILIFCLSLFFNTTLLGDSYSLSSSFLEYDCIEKNIDTCQCGDSNCHSEICRFKWLALDDQIRLLSEVDDFVRSCFFADHPEIIYVDHLNIPDAIEIEMGSDNSPKGAKIISKNAYQPGDVIYELTTLFFSDDRLILFRMNNRYILVDNIMHTAHRENSMREFYYCDSFMNHSCDPNTITFYTSKNHFEARALKVIAPGDELTCDYAVFDTDPDGDGFECLCGSPNCRGWVY